MSAAAAAADAADAAGAVPDVQPALAVVKSELDPANMINLIVKQQNGAVTHFRMKRDAPFKKVNPRTQSASSYPPPHPGAGEHSARHKRRCARAAPRQCICIKPARPPPAAHGHFLFAAKPRPAHREVPVGRAHPAPRVNAD